MISLNDMSALANALVDADAAVEDAEKELKEAKERARLFREETIPSAMHELGLEMLKLETGEMLRVTQEVYASVPAAQKPAAWKWLNDHGFGGLIKIEVSVPFGKGEQDRAVELAASLSEKGFDVQASEDVHAQTLKAFLKEQLAKGADIPLDLFGARPVWTAKITKK